MHTERTAKLLHMFNEVAPLARTLGMRLSFTAEGNAVVDLPYNPNLDHGAGGIHGGIYATLLDSAGWFTSAAAHDEDAWITTAEMSIHFLQPVDRRALRAVGRLIKKGKRQDVAEVHLYDDAGRLVAHATGTFVLVPGVAMGPQKPGS
jgi:uncharacterized protein (TIGR00369 family)